MEIKPLVADLFLLLWKKRGFQICYLSYTGAILFTDIYRDFPMCHRYTVEQTRIYYHLFANILCVVFVESLS